MRKYGISKVRCMSLDVRGLIDTRVCPRMLQDMSMEATEDARISETFSKCAGNGPPKGPWLSVPGDFIKYFRVGQAAHTRSDIEPRSEKKKIFF